MAKMPTDADFSDPRLVRAFAPELYMVLAKLEKEASDLQEWGEDSEFLNYYFTQEQLKDLKRALDEFGPFTPHLGHEDKWWKDLRRAVGLNAVGCEICRREHTVAAHIVTKAFMRRAAKVWKQYKDHPMNVMRLCSSHHDANDHPSRRERKDRPKFARLYRARAKMTRLLRREAEYELKRLEALEERLWKASDAIQAAALKELGRLTAWVEGMC